MSKRPQKSILHFFGKRQRVSDSCAASTDLTRSTSDDTEVSTSLTPSSPSLIGTDTEVSSASSKTGDCIKLAPHDSQRITEVHAHPYDIGVFAGKDVPNEKKLDVLNNVWVPDPEFVFPTKGKRNLRFQHKWLYRWKWLAYSEFHGGAFCKFCSLFSPTDGVGSGKQALGQLCKVKFENWKDAIERFSEHEKCLYHKQSIEIALSLGDISCGKKTSISAQLNRAAERKKLENRRNIAPIIETVLFCGRQCLALRGHRDSGRIDADQNPEENDGNFRALLRFRSNNDAVLKNMLNSSSANAQYISPRIQNEIIEACNNLILRKLVKEVNGSSFFSILADETADIAGTEQLSLCIRHVDAKNGIIKENFLQFMPIYDMTGKGIATVLIDKLRSLNVNIRKLRGQGYDGAASMSGKINGLQAHVREIVPSALYVHCSAHSLNLAVSTACEVSSIRNCMGTIASLYDFLNTPKRQHVLTSVISEMKVAASRREKLKQLCATRWLERYDSVAAVVELYDEIVETLQLISEWKDKDTSTQANSLFFSVTNCQFLISLLCIHKVFSLSVHLCRFLQRSAIDLVEAVNLAEDISSEIKSCRDNANSEFSKIFISASEALEKFGSSIKMPRVTGKQTNRVSISAATPEEYFRISIFIPLLDSFLSQLDLRFLKHREIFKGFQCILPVDPSVLKTSQIEAFSALTKFYTNDLEGCQESLNSELTLWYKRIARAEHDKVSPPKSAIEALAICNQTIMPNIFRLLEILAVLPVSTCTNERSFSTLRRLKTYLRNSTGSTRMNGLALLNIHRNHTPTVEEVLNELAKNPRRLDIAL